MRSTAYTIGRASSDDAATIVSIQRRAFAEEARRSDDPDIPPMAETIDAIATHIREQTALVARQGDRVVGSVRGIVAGTTCTIRGLGIEPELHGQGIGSSLLRAIEAAHPRVERFDLTTNAMMDSNVRFYERHGYRVTERTRHTDRITLAQMTKAVLPSAA